MWCLFFFYLREKTPIQIKSEEKKIPFLLDNNRISFELAYVPIYLSSTESFQGLLRPGIWVLNKSSRSLIKTCCKLYIILVNMAKQ